MLVSVVVDPRCFGPDGVRDVGTRNQVEQLLRAVRQNLVLLVCDAEKYQTAVGEQIGRLPIVLRQQVEIRWAEVLKTKERSVAVAVGSRALGAGGLLEIAASLKADAIVRPNAECAREMPGTGKGGIEIFPLEDFTGSATEELRQKWLGGCRLDQVASGDASELVGRVVRYATRITIADRMIGVSAQKPGGGELRRFVQGALYVVQQWVRHSPYADSDRLEIRLLSIAGATWIRGGWIDPGPARRAIEETFRQEDREKRVKRLIVDLKQEDATTKLRDRFIAAKGRCWGLRHGVDDLGNLWGPQGKRKPTFLDPHSEDNLQHIDSISRLPDAK